MLLTCTKLLEPFCSGSSLRQELGCGDSITEEGELPHRNAAPCPYVPCLAPAASLSSHSAFVCTTSGASSCSGDLQPAHSHLSTLLCDAERAENRQAALPGSSPSPPLLTTFTPLRIHLHFLPPTPFGDVGLGWWQIHLYGGMAPGLFLCTAPILLMTGDSPFKRYRGDTKVVHRP